MVGTYSHVVLALKGLTAIMYALQVTGQLKTNNAKLKGLVEQMAHSRNFCVDVVLICIILAIGETGMSLM